ncbi:MAG TPA: hypothetical protein VE153_17510 [Myxococcus sp.]|nr:hypothetical protein [Myxococcus sp.]
MSFRTVTMTALMTLTTTAALAESPREENLGARTLRQAQGEWASEQGEVRVSEGGGRTYLTRHFLFTPDANHATFVFYTDASFQVPNLTLRFWGGYTLLGESPAVKGALEAEFPLSNAAITPNTEGAAAFLNSAPAGTCGTQPWQVGVEQDVTASGGCILFGLNTATTVEYDLLKVQGNRLYFGARPADGGLLDSPERRPTALQVPVVRVR